MYECAAHSTNTTIKYQQTNKGRYRMNGDAGRRGGVKGVKELHRRGGGGRGGGGRSLRKDKTQDQSHSW